MSLAQLAGRLHNLFRDRGSNPGHPASPHLNVWAPATRLIDKKKLKKKINIVLKSEMTNESFILEQYIFYERLIYYGTKGVTISIQFMFKKQFPFIW